MAELIKKVNDFLTKDLWHLDTVPLNRFRTWLVYLVKLIYATVREFTDNELTLRAMSLVYTTLLSIVPLLAFSVSILKAFGVVDNQVEPLLANFLEPLGEKGTEITGQIIGFINNINFGVLGIVGLLMLIYTSISLIMKIEDSLNHIWKVKKGRSLVRRFSDYISILLIGPVFMLAAIGLTASFESNAIVQRVLSMEPLGTLLLFAGKLIPYLFVFLVFTFIYIIIPNTKVKFKSALIGGAIAGIAWQTTGWVFAFSVAKSTRYAAIYSSLAMLILFMIWLYVNWLIMLIGAQIAYCHQNLKSLDLGKRIFQLSSKLKEKLSFMVMYLIGYNFYHNKEKWTNDTLTQHLGLPQVSIESTIKELEEKNLILEVGEDPVFYLPAKDIEAITLTEILDAARVNKETTFLENRYLSKPEVDHLIENIDEAIHGTLGKLTLRDLILNKIDKVS
ncbi:MAG: YihY/virulence factor BrkB family protein [Candidatus Dadabacteria bacterium]|nr:MAG: YihY/virulence factor BrkB family protein [Candidatus Dadabacteria bacterium]TDJ01533.1 MAG: YihY/virulence factor BrkB family protein [Candidatus Dadabacteria bacterium]